MAKKRAIEAVKDAKIAAKHHAKNLDRPRHHGGPTAPQKRPSKRNIEPNGAASHMPKQRDHSRARTKRTAGGGGNKYAPISVLPTPSPADPRYMRASIYAVKRFWRVRQQLLRDRNRLIVAYSAMMRSEMGWTHETPPAKRKQIELAALKYVKDSLAGKPVDPQYAAIDMMYGRHLAAAHAPIAAGLKEAEAACINAVKATPYWPILERVEHLGEIGLAGIIGYAGDLSLCQHPYWLYRRFGLAFVNGERQRKTTNADLAQLLGYSPQRRAFLHTIAVSAGVMHKGRYRAIYDESKAREQQREIEGKPITKIHAHRRALRVVAKAILLDVLEAWRAIDAEAKREAA